MKTNWFIVVRELWFIIKVFMLLMFISGTVNSVVTSYYEAKFKFIKRLSDEVPDKEELQWVGKTKHQTH